MSNEIQNQPTQWQPINTAPHDGTIVDLWHKDGFRITDVWWADDDTWCGIDGDSAFTHWAPVTIPPDLVVNTSSQDTLASLPKGK